MAIQIAIAVVEHGGRFLIGRRPEGVPLAGLWEFPGGKIEPGETAEAAAVRECREETGAIVEPVFRYPPTAHQYEHDQVELEFIGCRLVGEASAALAGSFRWVASQELAGYEFPAANRKLLELLMHPENAIDCSHTGTKFGPG